MPLAEAPESPDQPQRPPHSRLRALLPVTTVALIIAILYVAWTFYSRYEANRKAEADAHNRAAERNRHDVQQLLGSGDLSIRTLTIDKASIRTGETAQLCYSVAAATAVKIDPPVADLKPSYLHCLEIAPRATTTYTLTASDAANHSISQQITIQVK